MVKLLSFATLSSLSNGTAVAAIDYELGKAIADTIDRGADGQGRSVTIKVNLKPVPHRGIVEDVEIEVEAKCSLPPQRSPVHHARPRGCDVLLFQDHDPTDPRQATLDEAGDGTKQKPTPPPPGTTQTNPEE